MRLAPTRPLRLSTTHRKTAYSTCRSLRRGIMWMQPFFILFFVLLVVIAIFLLSMERQKLKIDRPTIGQDLRDARTSATLISMLRRPAVMSEKTLESVPLADIIIRNFDGRFDKDISEAVKTSMPKDVSATLIIEYAAGRKLEIVVPSSIASNALDSDKGEGIASATLPGNGGNTKITMKMTIG